MHCAEIRPKEYVNYSILRLKKASFCGGFLPKFPYCFVSIGVQNPFKGWDTGSNPVGLIIYEKKSQIFCYKMQSV